MGKVKPVRVQRSRQHKMVSPNGLPIVYVGRPTKWGNSWYLDGKMIRHWGSRHFISSRKGKTLADCVAMFKDTIAYSLLGDPLHGTYIKAVLKGKNLACWCPLDQPCHADVLLEVANK